MKRPTFEELFSRNGRMPMVPYVLTLLLGLIAVLIFITLQQFFIYLVQSLVDLPSFIVRLLVSLPFMFIIVGFLMVIICAAIRRLHDFGFSGRWTLLILIPVINILCLIGIGFVPSSAGPNEYGPDITST